MVAPRVVLALAWAGACGTGGTRAPSDATGPQGSGYPAGRDPRAVVAADVDRDADVDVVVVSSGSGDATVLLNDGRGVFAPAPGSPFAAGTEPSDVAAVDLDRDGILDLIVANHETSHVTVMRGDGNGRFAPLAGSPFETGARPHLHGLAAQDFDGDGFVDVAVESVDDDTVRVLFGGGLGFEPALAFPGGRLPYYRVGAGDVTGDGAPELLVPAQRDQAVTLLGGAGRGRLAAAAPAAPVGRTPWMVRAGDVDGDGRLDLAVIVNDGVEVLRGLGGGHFERVAGSPFEVRGATDVALGDVDGDGAAEIAVGPWDGDEVVLFAGRTFARRAVRAGRRPVGLALADVDGDHRAELIAAAMLDGEVIIRSVAP